MDLDKLSLDDLKALRSNNLDAMSLEGLQYLKSARAPAAPETPPDTGFTGALKSSAEQIQADYERIKGKLGIKPIEEAEKAAQEHEDKAQKVFKPTEEGWLEAPWTKLKETAGGSLPYMALPVAAGAATLALPEAAAAAPVLGGLATAGEALGMGAAGLTSAAQFTGSNLSRQVQEGKSLQEASLGKAALAAIPQAAMDVVGLKYIPGIQKIFKSVGQDITEEAAKKMMEQGILRTAGQYVAGGAKIAGIEGANEAGQQFFERLQAGLNIADPDARKEYIDNFIGGAALGAVAAPFGVHGHRADARSVLDKAQAARDEQAFKEQEEADKQTQETAAAQKEMQGMAPKGPTEVDVERDRIRLDRSAAQITEQKRVLEDKLNELRTQASEETDLGKLETITTEAQKYHTALDDLDGDKVKSQMQSLHKDTQSLRKQLTKVKDDPEAAAEIQASIDKNTAQFDTLAERFDAIEHANKKTATAEELDKQLAKKQKELDKAKETGDLQSMGKIIASMKALQEQHPGDITKQQSLFEGEGEDRTYPEYQKRLAAEQRAREAKSQEVLDQEAIQNQQQQEIEQSTGEKPKLAKYKEEMTSEEYTDLLAHKLVDLHTRPDTHVPAPLSPAQKAAETKRVNAINAAKVEFEAKNKEYQDLISQVDEQGGRGRAIYTARGDVAAMGKKLAEAKKAVDAAKAKMIGAIPDGTKTVVESGRASEAAQDVHLLDLTDTIDSMRKGEWFGGANPKAASSMLSTLATKARSSLDKYIQATVSNINYTRLAKGMDRLSEAEKEIIVKHIDILMGHKIERATGKKASAMVLAERIKNPLKTDLADVEAKMEPLRKQGYTAKSSPVVYAALENKANEIKAAIAKVDAAVENGTIDQIANQYGMDTTSMPNALRRAGFRTTEQEVKTGFHRNEYKDVQRDIAQLKEQYTQPAAKERGRLQKITPEAASQYAGQKALTQRQAQKNAKAAKPVQAKTDQEITEAREKAAKQQTGLGIESGVKRETVAPKAGYTEAALPHEYKAVQAAFNFAKQYYKEMLSRRSMVMNKKQREALKETRKKYKEARVKLNELFKDHKVNHQIARIMNWQVTADEKTRNYRRADNLILGIEEKMQRQAAARQPKVKTTEFGRVDEKAEAEIRKVIGQYSEEEVETPKSPPEKAADKISETQLAAVNTKLKERLKEVRDRIYGLGIQAKEETAAERAALAKEQTKLEEQTKDIDKVLSARRVGMIVGEAQEEKGAKRYKATDTEKKMVKEGKFNKAGVAPLVYANVVKTVRQIESERAQAKPKKKAAPIAKAARDKIKELAAVEVDLAHAKDASEKGVLTKRRNALQKEIAEEANKKAKSLADLFKQEAEEAGIDEDAFFEIADDMEAGDFEPRIGLGKSSGIQMLRSAAQAVVDKIKLPKGLKMHVVQELSATMKNYILERGLDPEFTKGFITKNGHVVIVASAHKTAGEVAETIAHEVTGHLGVEQVLGEQGMKSLVNKITKQEGGIQQLANKLGVGEEVAAIRNAAITAGDTEAEADEKAVHEMIAHTAEKRPTKDWVAKANEFIKALVGEFRTALRRMGINLDTSTSDIYKILRDARKDFKEVNPGAYREANGNIQFSSKPKFNDKFKDLGSDVSKIVHANKTTNDKVRAVAAGFKTPKDIIKTGGILSPQNRLALRTRYVDRFAPMEKVAEKLTAKLQSSLEGTQLMYYLRMFDQGINWVAQTASHGPMSIIEKKRADGKLERIIETKDGASLLKVSQALKEADVGDANAANQLFTFYLAAKRAKRVGLNTLNFGDDVTQEMLDKVTSRINSDAKTKAAFEKAATIYNEYNKGLIEFGVQTGRFSKEEAAKLLKENDYVPFYRIDRSGNVSLDIGGANPISIGNVKDQPYLHELVGDNKPILDVFTSALQNTRMLTDMALRNLASRNAAFSLQQIGGLETKVTRAGKEFGSGIYQGKGEANPNVIRFKIDGVDHHAIVDTETMGIPADLLVKGLDGVQVSIPNLVKVAGYPAKLLRSFITRNPAYAIRQIARDSLSNAFITGADSIPIIDNMKQLGSMLKGVNEGELLLKKRGILGGQVLGNASDAMQKAMLQIIDGKPGWEKAMAYLDHVAMMGDASSRVTSYNSFVKQGLSDMEATLASLEAMNFSKKGTSPSLYLLNQMVPFLNAQIQGMDVLYKAFAGKMPFADKLDIKSKIWKRGAMMAAFTMAYTAMSYDDDDYKNATAAERIGNWFIKVPGIDEKVKVPIPFEVGGIFKMLPEMLYSTAFKDKKLSEAAAETSKYVVDNFIPSFMPTAIKPVIEMGANYSFFTGKPIESQRLMELAPGQRAYANTPEALKALGEATNISPVKMEYLLRSYTGSFPLAMMALANPVSSGAEAPEGRGALSSTTPVIGAFFQPKDANGLIDKAYQQMQDVIQADRTFKNYIESGRDEEAEAFLTKEADLLGMATFSGNFRKQMGDLAKQERAIRSMTGITGAEKRKMLDDIKEAKIEISKAFISARE